jgi:glycosyltransferase involved in cell wall biosynthesis
MIRRCRPDAVILMFLGLMYRHHPMITFAPSIIRRLCPRARIVTQFENLGSYTWTMPSGTRLIRKLVTYWVCPRQIDYEYGALLRDSDALVFLSASQQSRLDGRDPGVRRKAHLIPAPPNVTVAPQFAGQRPTTRKELGIADDEFVLLYYGYIYPGKGIELILRAMADLLANGRKLRLLIVGGPLQRRQRSADSDASEAYYKSMQAMTAEMQLSDRVRWLGPLPCTSEDLSRYIFAADACVLPFKGGVRLNNSSFAACAVHGLPIITTRSEQTEPDFKDHLNVLLCPPESPGGLRNAVAELIESEELQQRLSSGVKKLAIRWHSWSDAIEHTCALLRNDRECTCRSVHERTPSQTASRAGAGVSGNGSS